MIFRIFGIDQNVINEYHYEFVEFLHEDRVHEIHKICWSIGKTKQHDQIFVESISGGKGYFWNVTWPDLDLMIAGTKINLREYFGSG
jgi:aspartate ammonia-lyase